MTITEAVKHVTSTLSGIRVPASEIQSIGLPIAQSIEILTQCVTYMDQVEQEQAAREAAKQEEEAARKAAEAEEAEREEMNQEEKEEEKENDKRSDV